MKIIEVTDVNGKRVPLIPAWIEAVRYPINTDIYGTNAVVILSGYHMSVQESVEQMIGYLKAI